MKKFLTIAIMMLTLCLSSCSTKESAISDLRSLRNDINDYGYRYEVSDWQNAVERYKKIDGRLNKYADKYTYEESREIGRLKGECVSGFAKGVAQNVGTKAGNLKAQIEGLMEGVRNAFGN